MSLDTPVTPLSPLPALGPSSSEAERASSSSDAEATARVAPSDDSPTRPRSRTPARSEEVTPLRAMALWDEALGDVTPLRRVPLPYGEMGGPADDLEFDRRPEAAAPPEERTDEQIDVAAYERIVASTREATLPESQPTVASPGRRSKPVVPVVPPPVPLDAATDAVEEGDDWGTLPRLKSRPEVVLEEASEPSGVLDDGPLFEVDGGPASVAAAVPSSSEVPLKRDSVVAPPPPWGAEAGLSFDPGPDSGPGVARRVRATGRGTPGVAPRSELDRRRALVRALVLVAATLLVMALGVWAGVFLGRLSVDDPEQVAPAGPARPTVPPSSSVGRPRAPSGPVAR